MSGLTATKIRRAFEATLPPTALAWWTNAAADIQNEMITLARREGIEEAWDFMVSESYLQKLDQDDSPLHEREHPEWDFHPDFKQGVMPHLEDYSWHNDSMPCFCDDATGVMIWVDHLDPDQREYYHKQDVDQHEDVMYYAEQATGKAGEWEHDNHPLLRTNNLPEIKTLLDQHRSGAGLPTLFAGSEGQH